MGESKETIQARKDVARDHVRNNWKRGMNQREARALLHAQAKALSFPNMYDCVFGDDPDFVGDMLAAVAEEVLQSAHARGPVASSGEPLTAASLEENERSLRELNSIGGDSQRQQEAQAARNSEQPAEMPSYHDDETDQPFNIPFIHPGSGQWCSLTARKCREKESFITVAAVTRCHLTSRVETIRGVSSVVIDCRLSYSGAKSAKTFGIPFRIVENDNVKNDVAIGSDAGKECGTPIDSDSGFHESESAESIGVAGVEHPVSPPQCDNGRQTVAAALGRMVQDAALIGACTGQPLTLDRAAIGSSNLQQLPSRSRSRRRKGS